MKMKPLVIPYGVEVPRVVYSVNPLPKGPKSCLVSCRGKDRTLHGKDNQRVVR